jgi:hypothetical protein
MFRVLIIVNGTEEFKRYLLDAKKRAVKWLHIFAYSEI